MQGLQSCFHQGAVLLSRGHLSTSRHLYDKVIIQLQMSIVEVEKPRCKEEVLRKSYLPPLLPYICFCTFHRVMALVLAMIRSSTFFFTVQILNYLYLSTLFF